MFMKIRWLVQFCALLTLLVVLFIAIVFSFTPSKAASQPFYKLVVIVLVSCWGIWEAGKRLLRAVREFVKMERLIRELHPEVNGSLAKLRRQAPLWDKKLKLFATDKVIVSYHIFITCIDKQDLQNLSYYSQYLKGWKHYMSADFYNGEDVTFRLGNSIWGRDPDVQAELVRNFLRRNTQLDHPSPVSDSIFEVD
ncbi:hypothetical protein [Streptococcus oricebi]|uniref:Uncharacterized protein n=1 Tax=Streptococcus oricebi TaxID=1547447 RepID=A0ABS5B1B8_9STRE|nr:hypothetical protein [Streptococcus oricebi]MBP2622632.1 hypothetical protein [Streptococcus oricebi]